MISQMLGDRYFAACPVSFAMLLSREHSDVPADRVTGSQACRRSGSVICLVRPSDRYMACALKSYYVD